MYQPLADLLRPESLDQVYGQEHILGPNGILRRLVESGNVPNMIFYGPSGTGKTTVANIIAKQTNRTLFQLNATTASTADIKNIVSQLDTLMAPNGVLLYLDEIQSFNKKQQQSLLEHIENGKITLIASTTENPYFYVFNAILSRSTVFEFKQIDAKAALQAVNRAVSFLEKRTALKAVPEAGALEYIANCCGGDLRKALNAVYARLMQLDGVIAVCLRENKTSYPVVIDGITLGPHSIYASVLGGTNADVANALYRTVSAGCDFNGNVSFSVTDLNTGVLETVKFDRPTALDCYVRLKVSNLSQIGADLLAEIQQAVRANFYGEDEHEVNGMTLARLKMGDTLYAPRFTVSVQDLGVDSLLDIDVSLDGSTWSDSVYIPIDREPVLPLSHVIVV